MKKLMIALAAAATTMLSFGAGTAEGSNRDKLVNDFGGWTGTSFEALGAGSKTVADIVRTDDTGDSDGKNKFWYSAAPDTDELGTITNEVAGAGVSRPDAFAKQNQANTKSLQIDTTSPLFRTALPNSGGVQPVDIGDGIYLDTLVKFTAADEVFGTNALEAVDKIAIEYVERDADETAGITALTNFVVRAGFIGSELFVTNYAVALPDGWIENNKKDDWHRLTVRALLNIDGQNRVGFKIYLDENMLTYVTDNDEFAQSSGIDDATHTIFPSAVETDKNNYSDISSVAFSGSGFIDDVVFTTEVPEFIKNSEAVVVPFVADAGVTAITVTVPNADPILVDMTAATLSATLPAQTAAFTVTATVNTADGYEFVSIKVGDTSYDVNPASVTGYAGESITITTARNNFNLFDADGNAITTGAPFQKLSEVLETEGVAKIVLAHDYDVAESEGAGYGAYDIPSDITLDLNGNTITGGGDNELFTVGNGVTMIVIDSSAANTGKINYTGTYAVFYSEGDVVIGALTGDYGPSIDGYLAAAEDDGDGVWLVKGKIEAATNSDGDDFLWDGYFGNPTGTITAAAELDSDEEYWVVTPQGGSTTFALATTGGENAEIVTDPANVSALTEATDVTITATATNGFTYATVDLSGTGWSYNSNDDAISMTTNISENTTVVVPDAVSEQSQEDWPEGQDLIDAEGKAAGDLFSGITNALATADAKAVATWAEANNVAYADKGSILPEAFLLDCANTQAAIDEAAANFKITAITVSGDTVTIAPADGADYGNGKVVIEGTATLSPISWHEKTDGDHFFRATLVVKPVAVP